MDSSSQLCGLLCLSLVSYCNFWFWAPGALRLKIVPVITTDTLMGVKLIVKSGTFKSFLHLALISTVTFEMSDVSFQLFKALEFALSKRRFKASKRKDSSTLMFSLQFFRERMVWGFLYFFSVFVNSICSRISSRIRSRQTSKANANFSPGFLSWMYRAT